MGNSSLSPGSSMVAVPDKPASPLEHALHRVGDRWTMLVIDALQAGPRRFNELIEAVRGIAPNILSQRLKHLERTGDVLGRSHL